MSGPVQDVVEEDAADLQFPKGTLLVIKLPFLYLNKCIMIIEC